MSKKNKKPYQVRVVDWNWDGDEPIVKSLGFDTLEEASAVYTKILKKGGPKRISLLVNEVKLAGR